LAQRKKGGRIAYDDALQRKGDAFARETDQVNRKKKKKL